MAEPEMSDSVSLDVYFDFLCPFVYKTAVWLQGVQQEMGQKLTINWRYFSLEQVNNEEGAQWKIWEQPQDYRSRGLPAFRAAEAARCQGEAAFDAFRPALLKARHEQNKDIADTATLLTVAESVNLEMSRFRKDLGRRQLLGRLAQDHTFAAKTLGIFGTPTLVFPDRKAVFLKMSSPPTPAESLPFFRELRHLVEHRGNIQEVKRPQPPKG